MAPFEVAIVPMNYRKSATCAKPPTKSTLNCWRQAQTSSSTTATNAGVLLNDSELFGTTHRIVIDDRALKEANVEYAERSNNEAQAAVIGETVARNSFHKTGQLGQMLSENNFRRHFIWGESEVASEFLEARSSRGRQYFLYRQELCRTY